MVLTIVQRCFTGYIPLFNYYLLHQTPVRCLVSTIIDLSFSVRPSTLAALHKVGTHQAHWKIGFREDAKPGRFGITFGHLQHGIVGSLVPIPGYVASLSDSKIGIHYISYSCYSKLSWMTLQHLTTPHRDPCASLWHLQEQRRVHFFTIYRVQNELTSTVRYRKAILHNKSKNMMREF